MVTQEARRSAAFKVVIPQALMLMLLSGCLTEGQKQFFSFSPNDAIDSNGGSSDGSGSGSSGGSNGGGSTGGSGSVNTVLRSESFNAATSQVKKIDFLFLVDNSGSMADNQAKLAAGFAAFADTFYRRTDLDICTMIVTTDRYLGRSNGSYQRERTVPCTRPAGSETWTSTQRTQYINSVIADFKAKVNVGTNGNGTELPGKSLVTFLYNIDNWNVAINPAVRTSFFRADAVANISLVSDENNWYFKGNVNSNTNDLPPNTGASIYNKPGQTDGRKGIKNHLDDFFAGNLRYSVTALLELSLPNTSAPGLAMNLNPLVELVGRESSRGDLQANAAGYAAVYNAIGTNLVDRASSFTLAKAIYEPNYPNLQDLKVSVVRASGSVVTLANGSDYSVLMPNGIKLNSAVAANLQPGDQVKVEYRSLQ